AEVYTAVLRQYLGSRSDNSISSNGFTTTYVIAKGAGGADLADTATRQITDALAPVTKIQFVATRDEVIVTDKGCPHVPDGTILVTLGDLAGDDNEVKVATNGFVACLGATWLTYVVHNND